MATLIPIGNISGGGGGSATWDTIDGKPEVVAAGANQQDARDAIGAVPTSRTINGHDLTANVTVTKADVGLGNVDNTADMAKPVSTAVSTALAAKADLVGGVIPDAQLPPLALQDTAVVASQAAMLALTAQKGDVAVRTDVNKSFRLQSSPASTLANWIEIPAAGAVTSVAGKTGTVALAKADVGLGNVDNTADSAKPVSTAQQAALDAKVDKSGSITQLADVADTTPTSGTALVHDGTAYQPTDLTEQFAEVDSAGRLAPTAWQKYFVPTVVIEEGGSVPSDFPVGGIVFERPAPPSLVPVFAGSQAGPGASSSIVVATTVDFAVDDWIGIAVMTSGETTSGTLPTLMNSISPAAGAWTVSAGPESHQSGTVQVDIKYAKVTTLIPSGTNVTVTLNQSRVHKAVVLFKLPNIAATTPIDKTATGGNGSSSFPAISVGPTAEIAQADEVGILLIGHNDSTGATTRVVNGTNGWLNLGTVESDNGSSSRTLTVLYRVYSALSTATGTVTVSSSDGQTGAWAGALATFKAAA